MSSHYLTQLAKKCAADLAFEHPHNRVGNDAAKAQEYPWHPDLRPMPTCNPVNCSIKHLLSISSNAGKFEYACALYNSMNRRVKERLYIVFKILTEFMTSCVSNLGFRRLCHDHQKFSWAWISKRLWISSWPNLLLEQPCSWFFSLEVSFQVHLY